MKKIQSLIVTLCALMCLTACIDIFEDDSDKTVWEQLRDLDKSKIYKLAVDEYSGFDEALYHNGSYIAIKTDTVAKNYIYFVCRDDIDQADGIFVVLGFDGTPKAFGSSDNMMYACTDEKGQVSFMGLDQNGTDIKILSCEEDNKLSAQTLKTKGKNNGYDPYSWIYVFAGEISAPLGRAFSLYDFANSWKNRDGFGATVNAFCLGISFSPYGIVSLPISVAYNEWEQQIKQLHWVLYENAMPQIKSVTHIGDGYHEVEVEINDAEILSTDYAINVETYWGCQQRLIPRQTYLAVCANTQKFGDINSAYSISEEILIKNDEKHNVITAKTYIHIPEGKFVYLRPYLNSYQRLRDDKVLRMFDKQYKYGSDFPYIYCDFEYYWNQKSAIGQISNGDRHIDYQIELSATKPSQESYDVPIADWGMILVDKSGSQREKHSFVVNNESYNPNATNISTTLNFTFGEEDLIIDDNNYTAKLEGFYLCPYITIANKEWITQFETIYGTPSELNFIYDEFPIIDYIEAEHVGSYVRDGGAWAPVLINPEEKIYADAQSDFRTKIKIEGAFFMKRIRYAQSGSAWNKYCSIGSTEWHDISYIADGFDSGITSFNWQRGKISDSSTYSHYIEYDDVNGNLHRSNTLNLVPILRTTDDGKKYYFGFKPQI